MFTDKKLLPIKLHYFFMMAAMGPILPQLTIFGKEIGISAFAAGLISGFLPIIFFVAKIVICYFADTFGNYRKNIFVILVILTSLFFALIVLVLPSEITNHSKNNTNQTNFDNSHDLYRSLNFWIFVVLISLGSIGYNSINSLSDAICFDLIEDQNDYGKQRLWGSIGFGIGASISGIAVQHYSSYTPAFIIMIVFTVFDLLACFKLKPPLIPSSRSVYEDITQLWNHHHVLIFSIFSTIIGIIDSLIIYFLFWYVEDLAAQTNFKNVKFLEGLIVAAETFGGEILVFFISGKILEKLGHINAFTLCFLNYAIRLFFISIAKSPIWILQTEFVMQGSTYALTYATIVAYANNIAPPGTSATMQAIGSGVFDIAGYAIGSVTGGLMYDQYSGKLTFAFYALAALMAGILHFVLHKLIANLRRTQATEYNAIP